MIADQPPPIICEECRSPFTRTRKRTRFCCKLCSNRANSRLGGIATRVPLEETYERFVVRKGDDECWDWSGSLSGRYPALKRISSGTTYAHRFSWERANGPIPDGLIIRHKCDNPRCSNPRHLETGTYADNMADMVERGRSKTGESNPSAKLTHERVAEIKKRLIGGESQQSLAREYGVCQQTVSDISRGRNWASVEAST